MVYHECQAHALQTASHAQEILKNRPLEGQERKGLSQPFPGLELLAKLKGNSYFTLLASLLRKIIIISPAKGDFQALYNSVTVLPGTSGMQRFIF